MGWAIFEFLVSGTIYNCIFIIFGIIAYVRASAMKSYKGTIIIGLLLNAVPYAGGLFGMMRSPDTYPFMALRIENLVYLAIFICLILFACKKGLNEAKNKMRKEKALHEQGDSLVSKQEDSNSEMPGSLSDHDIAVTSDSVIMQPSICRKCGNKLLPETNFCRFCGTAVVEIESQSTAMITTEKFDQMISKQSPALRRAFIFLEDGEWDKAEDYFERVLDEEPENAYAYLGKAMGRCRISKLEEAEKNEIESLTSTRYYIRAFNFADESLASYLKRVCKVIK